ncbi:hypothetical protein [Streptomyces wedmorensis]
MTRLSGPHARFWRLRLAMIADQHLRSVAGGLPADRWLVHAYHRTRARPHPTLDRQLYQTWLPHLTATARDLINHSAAAAVHATRIQRHTPAATHLLQARHTLQHTCLHLTTTPSSPGTR